MFLFGKDFTVDTSYGDFSPPVRTKARLFPLCTTGSRLQNKAGTSQQALYRIQDRGGLPVLEKRSLAIRPTHLIPSWSFELAFLT